MENNYYGNRVFIEIYNSTTTYLTDTLGVNFIYITILITTVVSIIYFIVLSYLITQMDTRYFLQNNNEKINDDINKKNVNLTLATHSLSIFIKLIKIIIGVILLLCGIAMLVLPGQGLLTILVGLSLIPFPGKDKLELSILSKKSVRYSLNWIRRKANKEPFIFD